MEAKQDLSSTSIEIGLDIIEQMVSEDNPETDLYFYHSDLPIAIGMGSSSWITDASGSANQHLQYLPFGEDYIYQRTNSWNVPYTFSGKEKDNETGYSYFGARYYDSDLSIWLSVDPMASKYPSMSAYMYCAGNPVMLVDPDGRDVGYRTFVDRIKVSFKRIFNRGFRQRFNHYKNETSTKYTYGQDPNATSDLANAKPSNPTYSADPKTLENRVSFDIKYKSGMSLGLKVDFIYGNHPKTEQFELSFPVGSSVNVSQTKELKRVAPNTQMTINGEEYPDNFNITDENGSTIYNGSTVNSTICPTLLTPVSDCGDPISNSISGGNVLAIMTTNGLWRQRRWDNYSYGSISYLQRNLIPCPKIYIIKN